ncbi:hypothetical protein SETIT_9G142400v2 [Setaria italica]|uniref:Uncharacterized protein n=1 Tax=Setaria italica TaxID=4555 RepID=A0A368QFZ7_SETIT|nr:hypothetical protein SETIT_3G161100v2 [Setaria italica]RCV26214.1 hypothetical protein SETIT_5G227700v2 [Setaria italica]RCV41519.1 hypothetical protein SETIT_9G142400v2 [Setaria italica]
MDVDGSTSSVTPINRDTQEQDHTPPAQQKEHAPPALIDPITSLPFNPDQIHSTNFEPPSQIKKQPSSTSRVSLAACSDCLLT